MKIIAISFEYDCLGNGAKQSRINVRANSVLQGNWPYLYSPKIL